MAQRRVEDLLAAMVEISQQLTARMELMQQQNLRMIHTKIIVFDQVNKVSQYARLL